MRIFTTGQYLMLFTNYQGLFEESTLHFSRSGGKGGQNVNKVETKVELVFNIHSSLLLTPEDKERLLLALKSKLDSQGTLRITASSERTQLANRKKAEEKFIKLIQVSLKPKKKRKPTKPSMAAKKARLESKQKQSQKKESRRTVF